MAEIPPEVAPTEADIRSEDVEYNPAIEPKSAKVWLNMLGESEKAFEEWNEACDNIEKLYANLSKLRSNTRDKQFNLFWANLEILKPSIYAKPPVPVVVPKFKDRRPLYQLTSELLERCSIVAFDIARINDLLLLVRDDLATAGRGIAWCRYDPPDPKNYKPEYICIDHKARRDFLHSLSRNWREVTWVAAASYLTRSQARKRFSRFSKNEYQSAEYKVDKDAQAIGGADNRERAKFWEIWHKGLNTIVWVAEGCEMILDQADPREVADLQNFFPCPKPAYSVCQPGSLVPVPDVLQYRDQLEEVNILTNRIHALSEALEVKGFYPSGSAELSDAVQTAVKMKSPGRVLVPIANWAAFGGSKEVIVWLPIDMIANTITALIALRKQVIEDIYQIMGLSDIMRGATDPNETLGAQQIKQQYGSVRIRDKQQEMVRLARDVEEITAELMCAEFSMDTLLQMSQLDIPQEAQQQQKIQMMQQQMSQQMSQVQMMMTQAEQAQGQVTQQAQMAQGGAPSPMTNGSPMGAPQPPQLQQMQQQIQQQFMEMQKQIQQEQEKPTIERVMQFIRDYRTTVFVLDIETDSTIQADENAEKQRRGEFMGMMSSLIPQLAQLVAAEPGSAEFCGEILKFAVAPFRVGRTLDGAIDSLVEQIQLKASQGMANPKMNAEQQKLMAQQQSDQAKLQYQQQKDEGDRQLKMMEMKNNQDLEMQKLQGEFQLAMLEAKGKQEEQAMKVRHTQAQMVQDEQQHQQTMQEGQQKQILNTQNLQMKQQAQQDRRADMAQRQQMASRSQLFKENQAALKPFGIGR